MRKIFIYLTSGENLGPGTVVGNAMAEDGTLIAQHYSSSRRWAKSDMGVGTSENKHGIYRQYYPKGFEIVDLTDLTAEELEHHSEFQEAFKKEEVGGEQPA